MQCCICARPCDNKIWRGWRRFFIGLDGGACGVLVDDADDVMYETSGGLRAFAVSVIAVASVLYQYTRVITEIRSLHMETDSSYDWIDGWHE